VARALGRAGRQTRGRAGADGLTAARFEVFAVDSPRGVRHDFLRRQRPHGSSAVLGPPITLYRYIECPPARSAPARLGRIATALPRSTRAIPVARAIHSPRGKSFSAATTAAMSRTQMSPIAPATTSTIISAQQQPRQ